MRIVSFVLAVAMAAMVWSACDSDDDRIVGSGEIVTEDYELSDFTRVRITLFDAEVTQGDFAVSVMVDDNVLDLIEVEVVDDTLVVRVQENVSLSKVTLDAEVSLPTIEELAVAGAGQATLSGFEDLEELKVDVSGASRVSGGFDGEEFEVTVSGASTITGDVTAETLDLTISGASGAELIGTAEGMTLVASGASSAEIDALQVQTATVNLSGASNARVWVDDEIDGVDVSGASHLRYLGDPELRNVQTSGASTVDRVEG